MQERVAKEKSKSNEDVEKRMAELDKRELRMNAIDELRKNGLPDYLVDALNMNTDEDFQKSMEAIIKLKGESSGSNSLPVGTVVLGKGNPIGTVTKGLSQNNPLREAFGLD